MTGAVDAVVLAGGINEVPLFEGYAPGPIAMLTVGGRPLLEYTLRALRRVSQIRRVCIVGPNTLTPGGGYEYAPDGDTLLALGWRVGLSHLLGVHFYPVLTMGQMSRIASRRFGVGLVPVLLEHPEVAIDVDEAADYRFVEAQLAR